MRIYISPSRRIWTHHMKSFEFHDKFKPESCQKEESTMAATLGAGIQDGELFANMAKHDAIAVGGENAVCASPLGYSGILK